MAPSHHISDRAAFERTGAQHYPAAASAVLGELGDALAGLPADRAGIRLYGAATLHSLLDTTGAIGAIAAAMLGTPGRPVRAILFDKTAAVNWSLGWHQDRTIAVAARKDVEGFGPWTIKHGVHHVAPPFPVLAGMVTLRIHLDPVSPANAPLLIAPGSHRFGRIAGTDIPATVRRCGVLACHADAGDAWLYATPILHASEVATHPARRRVLQVDYASGELAGGLSWLGI